MDAPAILYSFRRCPYAIRARLALRAAGLMPGIELELREVSLKARPPELLEASAKATVPVLVLPDGQVLEESLAIMHWALAQADPEGWWVGRSAAERAEIDALIAENDGPFKRHLDRFKYPDRYPAEPVEPQRQAGLAILRDWSARLAPRGWLLGERPSLADLALLPFVRQFRLVDPDGFDAEPGLAPLQAWLQRFLAAAELAAVLAEPWGPRQRWRSPRWLYHLARAEEWRAARTVGVYERSTRGLSLAEVGFIHASQADQLADTWRRFYADTADVVLLHIDPERLAAVGVPVRLEPAPVSGELFPHLYGPLPVAAVRLVEPYQP